MERYVPANVARYVIVAALLVVWEVLPRLGAVPTLFLPPISLTVEALVEGFPEYARHMLVTLQEVAVSFVFACIGGVVCGIALGASVPARRLLLPLISSAYAVPTVILYSLFTAWFGIGIQSKIIFASVYGFLPTVLGAAAGVQTLDRSLITTARSMETTRFQRFVYVLVPATVPTVLTSIRVGGALVIVGVVVAEMLMSTAGIGFLISRYRTLLDSPRVFAAIILVLVLAAAFDALVQYAERRLSYGKRSGRSRASENTSKPQVPDWQNMTTITLSFDNGPDPETTPLVLDVLKRRDIRATFFVLGDKLRDRERLDICRRARDEGHWIGNHTFNHMVPLGLIENPDDAIEEIERTQRLLWDLADDRKFFRPFGGGGHLNTNLLNPEVLDHLQSEQYTCVLWNVVPRDWESPRNWSARALEQCSAVARPLVVLHDLPTGAMASLDQFIRDAKAQGMSFMQEFPEDCVPVVRGRVTQDMSPYTSSRDRH